MALILAANNDPVDYLRLIHSNPESRVKFPTHLRRPNLDSKSLRDEPSIEAHPRGLLTSALCTRWHVEGRGGLMAVNMARVWAYRARTYDEGQGSRCTDIRISTMTT
jgi:hypothetical protein